MSGSVTLAEQGTLTAMVGGPADALDRARPVLAAMTRAQFHLGPAGAGAAMKLAVNLIIAALPLPVAEVTKDSLDQACAAGYAEADFACAIPLLRRAATRG